MRINPSCQRRRPVGDRHRHRAHHLQRRRRPQRLRPLAAERPATGRPRGRAAVARQRADRPRPSPTADGRASFAAGLLQGPRRRRSLPPSWPRMPPSRNSRASSSARPPFDLSDRGIDGRAQPGPVDAFLYTERGIYRPGETVQLMALLRDARRDGARQHAGDPDREAARRQRVHALHPCAARPRARVHQAIALPKSSRRGRWSVAAHIDPKARAGRPRRLLGRGFRAREAQGRAHLRRADPAPRPGQRLRRIGRLPLRRAGLRPHGRSRHARHRRRPALPRLRQVPVRPGSRAREVRAAVHHAHGAGNRRRRQVAPRMGRRPGQGHRPAAAGPAHGPRVRARRRPRHQDRQGRADAHAATPISASARRSRAAIRAKASTPSSTSWPSMPRARRSRGRPSSIASSASTTTTSGTRSTAAGAGRRSQRAPADCRHDRAQGRRADAPRAPPELGAASPHRRRQARRTPRAACTFYVGWYGGTARRGDARHAAGGERQAELRAGRHRAAAHRGAVRRRGAGRHRHRPHRGDLHRPGARRRHHHRRTDEGRMGRRRLCAGHGLAAAVGAGRPHADARHRRGLARASIRRCARSASRSARPRK